MHACTHMRVHIGLPSWADVISHVYCMLRTPHTQLRLQLHLKILHKAQNVFANIILLYLQKIWPLKEDLRFLVS